MERAKDNQWKFLEPAIEDLVRRDHPYRKMLELVDFRGLLNPVAGLYHKKWGRPGYGVERGFKALLLQWMEDLSDRELERFLQENTSAKMFCDFSLTEKTPDHTYFCQLRKNLGTEKLVKLFNRFNDKMRAKGLISEVFSFVDASKLISKVSLWEERDKAIKAGEEKFNNLNISKYAHDKDADYGCKGENDFWYGYKRHVSVCMKHGFITKTAVTKASLSDAKGLKYVCPKQGLTLADKAYCTKEAQKIMKQNGCHSGAILKENMKSKNRDKDKFLTTLRMPYEGVFSKMDKKARYVGLVKNQFQATMQAFAHNIKRLIKIPAPPVIFV
jgi:IS5 family transposase